MRTVLVAALVAAAALVGCKTSAPGGGAGNDTFRVTVPALSTTVKQGETQLVRVAVERSEGFKQAVKLELKGPAGIQVDPDSTTVQPGDKGDVQLKITAAKDAPLGEGKILVKATPKQGEAVETEFKVTVSAM